MSLQWRPIWCRINTIALSKFFVHEPVCFFPPSVKHESSTLVQSKKSFQHRIKTTVVTDKKVWQWESERVRSKQNLWQTYSLSAITGAESNLYLVLNLINLIWWRYESFILVNFWERCVLFQNGPSCIFAPRCLTEIS